MKGFRAFWCDAYEPNDRHWQAHGPLAFDQSYLAYLCEGDPSDWYYVEITTQQPVTVDLAVPAVADYDLYLYFEGDWENPIAQSDSYGYGVGERMVYSPTSLGRYYVRVHPYAGNSNTHPYILEARR